MGKAGSLATLAAMPENLRAQAPVGRLLAWHQLKLVKGMLTAAVPFGVASRAIAFATLPSGELAQILDNAQAFTEDMDRLKQRGLYVDVDHSGRVREPSEVTAAEVRQQLDRARRATSAADALLYPDALPGLADPGADDIEFSRALVSAIGDNGRARSPEAAADVLRNTATKLRG